MRLTLTNIGRYDKYQIDLANDGLISITGDSGAGKSTLFRSIIWAITGEVVDDMDLVRHEASAKAAVSVKLEYQNFDIYRQRRPNLLQVTTKDGIVYQDDQAQAFITSNFGSKDLWLASSYISQEGKHQLLSSNAKDRLALIHEIAMATEDPGEYIECCQQYLKSITLHSTTLTNATMQLENNINQQAASVNLEHFVSPDQRQPHLQRLAQLPDIIKNLRSNFDDILKYQGKISIIEQQLAKLPTTVVAVVDNKELEQEQQRLLSLQQQWKLYDQTENGRKLADTLTADLVINQVADDVPSDLSTLQKVNLEWQKWNQLTTIFTSYGLDSIDNDSKDLIQSKISFIIDQLEQAKKVKNYKIVIDKVNKIKTTLVLSQLLIIRL